MTFAVDISAIDFALEIVEQRFQIVTQFVLVILWRPVRLVIAFQVEQILFVLKATIAETILERFDFILVPTGVRSSVKNGSYALGQIG